jgi:hypothetical protein
MIIIVINNRYCRRTKYGHTEAGLQVHSRIYKESFLAHLPGSLIRYDELQLSGHVMLLLESLKVAHCPTTATIRETTVAER